MKKKALKKQVRELKDDLAASELTLEANIADLAETDAIAFERLQRIIELERLVNDNEANITEIAISLATLRNGLANDALELVDFLVEAEKIVSHWARTHNDHDLYRNLIRLHRKWKENLKYLRT